LIGKFSLSRTVGIDPFKENPIRRNPTLGTKNENIFGGKNLFVLSQN